MRVLWHLNCSFTLLAFGLFQEKKGRAKLGLFFRCFISNAQKGRGKGFMKKVSILLTLFIFASINHALCDPVKSIKGDEAQVTAREMGKNGVVMQKKAAPAKKPTGWIKKNQTARSDINFLRTLEEKERSPWVESPDKVISFRDFSENVWKNQFSSSPQMKEIKSSGSNSRRFVLTSNRYGNGSFEEGNILTTLRLLHSKEHTFKEIFMGFRFSLDLTSRRLFLQMNVAPSTETTSGFMIRF